MSLIEFSTTPYGRDFFRNVQKIADSLVIIAEGTQSKDIHQHRIGAAQRISLAIDYINNNSEQLAFADKMDIPAPAVITMLEAV
ncbi:MAG: hypothetical protein KAR20_13770, partial [Candidatus Heimdallarchaeota archaeon]|nr:hypothetical protein [Candidatus Heimdallarchaeota archaeon]